MKLITEIIARYEFDFLVSNDDEWKWASNQWSEYPIREKLQRERLTFIGHASKSGYGQYNLSPEEFVNKICRDAGEDIGRVNTIDLIGCGLSHIGEGTSYAFEVARLLGARGHNIRVNSMNNLMNDSADVVVDTIVIVEFGFEKIGIMGFRNSEDAQKWHELEARIKEKESIMNASSDLEIADLKAEQSQYISPIIDDQVQLRTKFNNEAICGVNSIVAFKVGENNWERAMAVSLIDSRINELSNQLKQNSEKNWLLRLVTALFSKPQVKRQKIDHLRKLRSEILDPSNKLHKILCVDNLMKYQGLVTGTTGKLLERIRAVEEKSRKTTILCICDSMKIKDDLRKRYIEYAVNRDYKSKDIRDQDNNQIIMRFKDDNDVDEFFEIQAKMKVSFIACNVNQYNELTGEYRISDESGNIIQAQIEPKSLLLIEHHWDGLSDDEKLSIKKILRSPAEQENRTRLQVYLTALINKREINKIIDEKTAQFARVKMGPAVSEDEQKKYLIRKSGILYPDTLTLVEAEYLARKSPNKYILHECINETGEVQIMATCFVEGLIMCHNPLELAGLELAKLKKDVVNALNFHLKGPILKPEKPIVDRSVVFPPEVKKSLDEAIQKLANQMYAVN